MKTDQNGINLIKRFEGFSAVIYPDPAGYPTIGFGHLIKKGENFPDGISIEEAEEILSSDLEWAEDAVNEHVTVPLTQNQFNALVSIIFNVGKGKEGVRSGIVTLNSGKPSTLLKKLNSGDYEGAADAFLSWDKAGGHVSEGLHRRRKTESELFLS